MDRRFKHGCCHNRLFKDFFIPVVNGTFEAPVIVHIHGAFAFLWIILFQLQTTLIYFNNYKLHRILGFSGLFIASGILITLIPTGIFVVTRDLSQGMSEASYSSLLGVITSGILFLSLVIAGLVKRNNPASHKRLMLLSIIVVLWPAWFRFRHYFPFIPRPEIWFALVLADSLIIVSWLWDKIKNGSVHPVLKFTGSFIILEQTFEVIVFDTPVWRELAKWIYTALT